MTITLYTNVEIMLCVTQNNFHLKYRMVRSYTEFEAGEAIKGLTVNELKAVNQQMEELGWI